jgi:hypothetical protein
VKNSNSQPPSFPQLFVCPRHIEQTITSLGHNLFLSPLPELSRLLSVVRDALKFGAAYSGRGNIVCHEAPLTNVLPKADPWALPA